MNAKERSRRMNEEILRGAVSVNDLREREGLRRLDDPRADTRWYVIPPKQGRIRRIMQMIGLREAGSG